MTTPGEALNSSPETEARRVEWLTELSGFIIEAGRNGWAAEVSRVETPQRPGFKEIAYQRDDWEYRDSYAGYYMAPGSSVVYYRGHPAWYMTYGGRGQSEEAYGRAKETFAFLRNALMQPEPLFPVRGAKRYEEDEGHKYYKFDYQGDLSEGSWTEAVDLDFRQVFEQRGDVGLIIPKDADRQPVKPWEL